MREELVDYLVSVWPEMVQHPNSRILFTNSPGFTYRYATLQREGGDRVQLFS